MVRIPWSDFQPRFATLRRLAKHTRPLGRADVAMLSIVEKAKKGENAIAIIYPGPHDGWQVVLNDSLPANTPSPPIVLPSGEHLALEPSNDPEKRDCIMVGGKSGSGKSHVCKNFAIRYHKLWPERPINLVSYLKKDETLDECDFIKRLKADSFLDDPPKLEEFDESLTIFDDIEGFEDENKPLAEAIQRVINMVATTGRHNKSSLIVASHLLTNFKKTRLFLGEAHQFVIFPHGVSKMQMDRLLGTYGGCDRKSIDALRKLPSRWVCLRTTYPPVMLHESGCYLLHGTEDETATGAKRGSALSVPSKRPREEEAPERPERLERTDPTRDRQWTMAQRGGGAGPGPSYRR